MPRLSVTLSDAKHGRLSFIAAQNKDSMSNIINQLIDLGIEHLETKSTSLPLVERHCQQLIIQMNALVKNLSAEILKFDQSDFDQLRKVALNKYNELIAQSS